jgi:hypothetical protein
VDINVCWFERLAIVYLAHIARFFFSTCKNNFKHSFIIRIHNDLSSVIQQYEIVEHDMNSHCSVVSHGVQRYLADLAPFHGISFVFFNLLFRHYFGFVFSFAQSINCRFVPTYIFVLCQFFCSAIDIKEQHEKIIILDTK